MSRVVWRWDEKDLGRRFRRGKGRQATECYQAREAGQFYVVPAQRRKLTKEHADDLVALATKPVAMTVVPDPWRDYARDWDWVVTDDGLCLSWAGCLERQEVERREDEGVQRAMELVAALVSRDAPASVTQGRPTQGRRAHQMAFAARRGAPAHGRDRTRGLLSLAPRVRRRAGVGLRRERLPAGDTPRGVGRRRAGAVGLSR